MTKPLSIAAAATAALLLVTGIAMAQQLTVDMNRITDSGVGDKIGSVLIKEEKGGVSFKVAVTGIPAGEHGFHVHQTPDCGASAKDGKMTAGLAAGSHYDPESTKSHKGPEGSGHKGDLPVLTSSAKGIDQTVLAPRLQLRDVVGRSLVIHEGGDSYSDTPENGGGKGRIACGIIPGK